MTDAELQGIAAQALNMAKLDMERGRFNFLLASYHAGEGLRRMAKVEAYIIAQLGKAWLDSGRKKDVGFRILRTAVDHMPPDAIVFATAANQFEPTAKLLALPVEQQKKLAESSHDDHHAAVRRGLLMVHDSITCVAQTKDRVCVYTQRLDRSGAPEVKLFDQREFMGRMKMFGEEHP